MENLEKFYIQNKIIGLIKTGHSMDSIANLFGFELSKDKNEYYNELIEFHRGKSLMVSIKESTTNFMETDSDVKEFINNWLEYISQNEKSVYSSSI